MVIALMGLVVVGDQLSSRWPRDVEIEYRFARGTSRLEVDYMLDEEAMVSARFAIEPAETSLKHEVKLPPGRYEVATRSDGQSGSPSVVRALVVPAEGVVTLDLREP